MDAVALHDTRPDVHDEKQAEFFQAVGQTRQESLLQAKPLAALHPFLNGRACCRCRQ